MNRQVSPSMWANSPTRGPPPPCKEALGWNFFGPIKSLITFVLSGSFPYLGMIFSCLALVTLITALNFQAVCQVLVWLWTTLSV